ncbi:MAG: SPOR domain-containing protein [Bacteroidales bacterium]|nr:SPOR domain-containing protein [Bacteroidales bacterium]
MNITDHIVTFLKQGRTVEIANVGTLTSHSVSAHYDADTATFYPTRDVVTFTTEVVGNKDIIAFIAEQECVGMSTAEQMWKNYTDALLAKLESQASHSFPGLGSLQRTAGTYAFNVEPGVGIDTDILTSSPLADIHLYTPAAGEEDPFLRFEAEWVEPQPTTPQPIPPEPEPLTVEQPSTEPTTEFAPKPNVETKIEEVPPAPQPTTEPEPEPVPEVEAATTPKVTPEADAESAPSQPEEDVVEQTATATSVPQPEPEAEPKVVGQPAAEETAPVIPEPANIEEPQPEEPSESASEALHELQAMENLGAESGSEQTAPTKRKKHTWLWIILLLLLLLIGAAAFYYFKIYRPANTPSAPTEKLDIEQMVSDSQGTEQTSTPTYSSGIADDRWEETPATMDNNSNEVAPQTIEPSDQPTPVAAPGRDNRLAAETMYSYTNIFTFSTDNIEFNDSELTAYAANIASTLQPYIASYAKSKRYSKATALLQEKVAATAANQLRERLRKRPNSVMQILTYKDYVRQYCADDIKQRKAAQQMAAVQAELMDAATLDQMLDEVLRNHEVEADAVKAATPVAAKPAATLSHVQSSSKQGFDIVAGFYVNKSTADKMAASLKKKGCDAYIIDKNGLYYVSMGSAASRTKAEALYNHIKEWYKGDIAIMKW